MLVTSDTVSLLLVGMSGVVYTQKQKVRVRGEDGDKEIKEVTGHAVIFIRNEPDLGWRESQKVQLMLGKGSELSMKMGRG